MFRSVEISERSRNQQRHIDPDAVGVRVNVRSCPQFRADMIQHLRSDSVLRTGSTLVFGVLWWSASAVGQTAMTVDQLVRANTEAWAKITSLDLTYDATADLGDGPPRTLTGQRWMRRGERERIVVQAPRDLPRIEDFYFDGSALRVLRYPATVNPHTGAITVCDRHNVDCEIRPPMPGGLFHRRIPLLDVFEQRASREPLTLAAIARDWQTSVTKAPASGGSDTRWLLVATRERDTADSGSGEDRVELVIDESRGWLISDAKLTQWKPTEVGRATEREAAVFDFKVEEFLEFAPGQSLPARVLYRLQHGLNPTGDVPEWRIRFQVTEARVNRPMDPELGFRFPLNSVVFEALPEAGTQKIHIWGAGGKPQRTFDSDDAFEQYLDTMCGP